MNKATWMGMGEGTGSSFGVISGAITGDWWLIWPGVGIGAALEYAAKKKADQRKAAKDD